MDKERRADPPQARAAGGGNSPTTVARLGADAAGAQRLADVLAEQLAGASAVACYEDGPQWCVELHFAHPPDEKALRQVAQLAGEDAARALRFATIASRDWVAASLAGLKPVEAGRFVIHGEHDRGRIAANRIPVEIEASLAFGTGHHGTTRGCLLALDRLLKAQTPGRRRGHRAGDRARKTVALDIGTGSGVLAIAAAKAMRSRVLASDLDPAAVRIARDNACCNGVRNLAEVVQAAGLTAARFRQRGPYPLVLANILLGPLKGLAAPLARRLAPGARAVLSGLLEMHANAALAIYRSHGLRLTRKIVLDGWVTLVLNRAPARPSRR